MYHSLDKRIWFTIIFLPLKESHYVPDMDFFGISSPFSFHLELLRIELPKLTPSILMEIVIILVVLLGQFFFYMNQPIMAWLFDTNIFEQDYHSASYLYIFI